MDEQQLKDLPEHIKDEIGFELCAINEHLDNISRLLTSKPE